MSFPILKKRRLIAALLGTLFTVLLFEGVLRLTGAFERHFWQVEGRDVQSDKPVVLFVGNSHTMGTGAPKEKSFPNQLAERLKVRGNGSMPFEFVNVGRGNANSSFIVETLPGFLAKYRPAYVVVMTGETNQWNHYGYAKFASENNDSTFLNQLYDLAYHVRVFRFAQLFDEFVLKPRAPQVFSSHRESDRALYWISALDSGNMFDIWKMTSSELAEARDALEVFIDTHPDHVGALMAASEIRLKSADPEERNVGFGFLRKAYDLNGQRYNFRMDRSLSSLGNDTNQDLNEWARRLAGQRPTDYRLLVEYFDGLRTPSSLLDSPASRRLEFFTTALTANPTNSIARNVLYNQQLQTKNYEDALQTLIDGSRLNPFSNVVDWYAAMHHLRDMLRRESPHQAELISKIEDALRAYETQFPQNANSSLLISGQAIDRWLASDLEKIASLVRKTNAQLMLQTYLPEKLGPEKPADKVIRKFAEQNSIALSDTSQYFFRLEPDAVKRQRFFTTWYGEFDNHLGENGYAVIAELLEKDFERVGWIQKQTR